MVNLRFHIVSIVAVFLALAIGLLTGVTLLDRAVVEGLKGTQDALDDRNRELRDQNSGLREQADAAARRDSALTELLPQLDVADLEGVSVVVLATRGIDEATARSIPVLLGRAGANAPGILWFDDRTDLRNAATSARLADVWPAVGGREPGDGETGDDDAEAAAVVAGIADVLHAPATTTTTTTTTTASAVPAPAVGIGTEPATSEPTTTVDPAASDDAAAGLARLVSSGFADWDDPTGAADAPTQLDGSVRYVVLVGEGAVVPADVVMAPLVRRLVSSGSPLTVGEVQRPRSQTDRVDGERIPERARYLQPFLSDSRIADRSVIIDNVDQPIGRISLAVALARLDATPSAHYGESPDAQQLAPNAAG